eukprot:PITA_21516
MIKPLPTWRNRRIGEAALVRRIDRFVIKNQLLQLLSHYRQWVGSRGIFDHFPIYLEVTGPPIKPQAPFNFNSVGLQDPGYIEMVKNHWAQIPPSQHHSKAEGFCHNLLQLKKLTIKWNKDKQRKDNQTLSSVEADITDLTANNNRGFMSAEDKAHLIDLENKRAKEPLGYNLAEIIRVAGHFPRFVDQDSVDEISAPISREELEVTLKWFQKDKSPGPDGWPIEFYLEFFDTIGNDLLNVVEECILSGRMYEAINTTFIALIPKSDSQNSFSDF